MAFRLIDDYSGEPLDRNHPSLDLRVGVEGWRLYLSDASKEALDEALKPFIKDAEAIEPDRRKAAAPSGGRGRKPVDTYGYEFNDVRAWAIANQVTTKSGKPVSESTRVLNQEIYDQYKKAIS